MSLLVSLVGLLCVSTVAAMFQDSYNYESDVGSASGSPYSLSGDGRITALRVWDYGNSFIRGFQFRFGFIWSAVAGFNQGPTIEMELFDDEAVVQVSGKYGHYLEYVVFTTSRGRSLYAGRPTGTTFNMYARHPKAELRIVSGRYHGAITSFGTVWGVLSNSTSH